jgi:hypothetical protein
MAADLGFGVYALVMGEARDWQSSVQPPRICGFGHEEFKNCSYMLCCVHIVVKADHLADAEVEAGVKERAWPSMRLFLCNSSQNFSSLVRMSSAFVTFVVQIT